MTALSTPITVSLCAAAALIALIGAAMRLGLAEQTAMLLLLPVLAIALVTTLTAGATLHPRGFLLGEGSFLRRGPAILRAALVLLLAGVLAGPGMEEPILILPAMLLALVMHRLVLVRQPAGVIKPVIMTGLVDQLKLAGVSKSLSLLFALGQLLLLAGLLLLMFEPLATRIALIGGLSVEGVQNWMILISVMTLVLGGQRAALGLAILLVLAGFLGLTAILVAMALSSEGLILPFLSAPQRLDDVLIAMERWLPASSLPAILGNSGAITLSNLLGQASLFTTQLALALAVASVLALLRIEDSVVPKVRRSQGTGKSLVLLVLLVAASVLIPINAVGGLIAGLVGFDPKSLPLWLIDGRFAPSVTLCNVPMDAFSSPQPFCPAKSDGLPLSPEDIAVSADFLSTSPALIAGLPWIANRAIALTGALMGMALFVLLFARFAILLVRDVLLNLRVAPPTGSWSLAMTRLWGTAIGIGMVFVPQSWIDLAVQPAWLIMLAAALVLPQLVLLRVGVGRAAGFGSAMLAGPLTGGVLLYLKTAWPMAAIAGCAAGIAAGLLSRGLLAASRVRQPASA